MQKSDLLKSHDELRAVLRLAGVELKKRSIGRRDSPLLQLMRRTLREARIVAKAETSKAKSASAGWMWLKQLGEMLQATPKSEGGRPAKITGRDTRPVSAPTLAEIGISKDTSALAQKIASLPA